MADPVQGKVAKYQAAVDAYADVMEAKIQILKDYIKGIFTPKQKTFETPPPPKKSWWKF